ncbi:MAG TPA: hypothetical protein PKK31_02635 [Elusimicrobiales bacterium]|nr:hypothetical protein [Elusimicrobiales bacterium]
MEKRQIFLSALFLFASPAFSAEIYKTDHTFFSGDIVAKDKDVISIRTDSGVSEVSWQDVVCVEDRLPSGRARVILPPFTGSLSVGLNGSRMFMDGSDGDIVGVFIGYMPFRKFEFAFDAQVMKNSGDYGGVASKSETTTYSAGVNYYFYPFARNYLDWARSKARKEEASGSRPPLTLNPLSLRMYTGFSAGTTRTKSSVAGDSDSSSETSYAWTVFGLAYSLTPDLSVDWNMKLTAVPPVEEENELIYSTGVGLRFKVF